jgi:hypothetical protein
MLDSGIHAELTGLRAKMRIADDENAKVLAGKKPDRMRHSNREDRLNQPPKPAPNREFN